MSESCWCVPLLRLLPPWATSARFRISDNPSLEASEIDSGDAWSNEPTASNEGENGQSGTLKEGRGVNSYPSDRSRETVRQHSPAAPGSLPPS